MIAWIRIVAVLVLIVLWTLLLLPVQLTSNRFGWKLSWYLPRRWHRVAARLLGLRIITHGALDTHRPLMIAANHSSWKDIIVLSCVADVVFIAKSEVRSWPVFGWLARWQRTVFIERERRRQTGEQVSEVAKRLADGEIVVLFAEGTTSDGNRILDFKSSLFGAAASALGASPTGSVSIQPVAIAYTHANGVPLGRYGRPLAAWPGDTELPPHLMGILKEGALDVHVCFGEPVRYDENSNRKRVTRDIERQVRAMHQHQLYGVDMPSSELLPSQSE
ncbi:lysophospholipid acyltransferase family protein [Hoeflea prorocentri]|uniref:Lysophospholipid acyltransferase family protein n=1 Tax=Hoeflea prorocentri TaxID=1922333 RepID=A0A9X3UL20_9HYPH|nr:lysophospholipid acyltransferase family protein [Hoeflea prorocentri]MCY6382763.1 lysophospholipid acyltransferase family protein [Hoeflea prorocentri]MDA5400563.1 lysophospholipid acyltransferase family protein [Hoeflea prorocentri]